MRVAVSHFKEKACWNPAPGLLLFAWDGTDNSFFSPFCRQDGAPLLSDDIRGCIMFVLGSKRWSAQHARLACHSPNDTARKTGGGWKTLQVYKKLTNKTKPNTRRTNKKWKLKTIARTKIRGCSLGVIDCQVEFGLSCYQKKLIFKVFKSFNSLASVSKYAFKDNRYFFNRMGRIFFFTPLLFTTMSTSLIMLNAWSSNLCEPTTFQ